MQALERVPRLRDHGRPRDGHRRVEHGPLRWEAISYLGGRRVQGTTGEERRAGAGRVPARACELASGAIVAGRRARMLVAVVSVFVAAGCVGRDERVDPGLARAARHELLAHQRVSELEEFYEEPRAYEEPGSWTDVVIAQTLAIFPGIILHGAGHWYAGDRRTAKQLSRIGQFGYLLTAIGGGVVYGGYEADQAGLDGLATSLYAS